LACALSTISLLATADASAQIGSEYDSANLITLTCTTSSQTDGTKTEEVSIDPKNRTWDGDADGQTTSGNGWTSTTTIGISGALFTKERTQDMFF
jgi:hypothetical protein